MLRSSLIAVAIIAALSSCECGSPPVNNEGEGEATEGEGDVATGEGEGDVVTGEGEGDGGEGETSDAGFIIPDPVGDPDPDDNNNAVLDSDCDGIDDENEFGTLWPGGATTDPANFDTDGDGIPDGVEAGRVSGVDARCTVTTLDADANTITNPTLKDSDTDCLDDNYEDQNRNGRIDAGETDPNEVDSDADGLTDGEEVGCNQLPGGGGGTGTDPNNGDTDGDGLSDGLEVELGLDPNNADSDGDGIDDGTELFAGGDPGGGGPVDTDNDGIPDDQELLNGTDPNSNDSDGDGVIDGDEDKDGDGVIDPGESDPKSQDTDCDGLKDGEELTLTADPLDDDTDGDGLSDGFEQGKIAFGDASCTGTFIADSDPASTTNAILRDSDGDGINDGIEDLDHNGAVAAPRPGLPQETDPANPDTDNDGLCDGPRGVVGICAAGEDLNGDSFTSSTETDPRVADIDTDGDGISDERELANGTLPNDPDTDNDGMCDGGLSVGACTGGEDLNGNGVLDPGETDPKDVDTDCDAVSDAEEFALGLDPLDTDTDNDGITDGVELGKVAVVVGTSTCTGVRLDADAAVATNSNPRLSDTDGDGIPDGLEDRNRDGAIAAATTSPRETFPGLTDSDGDGLCDGPRDSVNCIAGEDRDGDGIIDPGETDARFGNFDNDGDGLRLPIDPNDTLVDSDGDGLCDGSLVVGVCTGAEDLDRDGIVDPGETDPRKADTDCDAVSDGDERGRGLNPLLPDSDNDGITDGVELGRATRLDCAAARVDLDPATTTNPLIRDSDGDGLLDGLEDKNADGATSAAGANPRETFANLADSDGDGLCDGPVTIAVANCIGGEDLDADGVTDVGETDPRVGQFDRDGDGIRTPTDPDDTKADTDGDGLCDGAIAVVAANCIAGEDIDKDGVVDVGETDPRKKDTDCDAVSDRDERTLGTNARIADSDGDLVTDGVEVGKAVRLDCATAPVDLNPATTTNPLNRDTDADGLNDGVEDANKNGRIDAPTATANETNPNNPDTDGDRLCDGPASVGATCSAGEDLNRNGKKDGGETDPNVPDVDTDGDGLSNPDELARGTNPNNPDTDADGINDGLEVNRTNTDPLNADTDCDGLNDGAEDLDKDGIVDATETDPLDADTDNDGLTDGLEKGGTCLTGSVPPQTSTQCLGQCVPDLNPATTTNPLDSDTDNDGIDDGAEDANQNGRVDPGELNPNNPADANGADAAACAVQNLRQITLVERSDTTADLTLAVPTDFPNNRITTLTKNAVQVGAMVFDPTRQVAGVAMKADLAGATASEKIQTTLNTILNGAVGDVGGGTLTVQSFTTWDGNDGAIGKMDWSDAQAADTTAKSMNDIVAAILGGTVAGTLSTTGSTDTGAPYTLQVEVMVRSPTSTVVVIGLARKARVTSDEVTLFRVDDLANGSAVAQFGDDTGTQCDRFVVEPAQKVDFILVIDNSGSMSNEQTAVARAAGEISSRLSQSTVDFRIGVLATDVDSRDSNVANWNNIVLPPSVTPKFCDFTTSPFGVQRCVRFDINGDGDIADTAVPGPFNETVLRLDLNGDGDAVDTAVASITETAVQFDINGDGDTADTFASLDESGLGINGSGEENGFRPVACAMGQNVTGDGINTNLGGTESTVAITAIDDNGAGGTVLITTAVANGFAVNDRVVVEGVNSGGTTYNATYTVTQIVNATQFRTLQADPGGDNDNAVANRGTVRRKIFGGASDGESCGRDGNRAPYDAANTFQTPPGNFRLLPPAANDKRKVRTGADLAVIFITDANDQSDGQLSRLDVDYPGDARATLSIPSWTNFFNDYDSTTAGSQRAFVHGIVCPNNGDCTDEGDGTPGNEPYMTPRYQRLIAAMGGIEAGLPDDADVNQATKIAEAIRLILGATVAQASPYVLTKPPISASIKIAFENTVTTFGACVKTDVPRSRVNGFDYDGTTNSIQFFGTCRPTFDAANLGRPISVSYKYWIEDSPSADGNIDPCNCTNPLICVNAQCICPSDCGTGGLAANQTCNTTTCQTECLPDCGGCNAGFTCDTAACACECNNCNGPAPGPGFTCNLTTCEYECSGCAGAPPGPFSVCNLATCEYECPDCGTAELAPGFGCNTNPAVCDVECLPDCGGCTAPFTCDTASCGCECNGCVGPSPGPGFACNLTTCQFECQDCVGNPPGPFSTCNQTTCQYECSGCGANEIAPGFTCNANPLVCDIECQPDCGGCSGNGVCNTGTCACECPADCGGSPPRAGMTCNQTSCTFECAVPPPGTPVPGPNFVWDTQLCQYVCDPDNCGVNTIGPEAICDTSTCELRCPADCGGCDGNADCNLASCACECPADCGAPSPGANFVCNAAACAYECLATPVTPPPGPNFVWNVATCSYECPADCGEPGGIASPEFCNRATCEVQCLPGCGGCAVGEECNSAACACQCVADATCAEGFVWNTDTCSCACDTTVDCGPTRVLNTDTCSCECGDANSDGVTDCNNACTGATPICQQSLCSCRGIGG